MDYKKLESPFTKNGFVHTLVKQLPWENYGKVYGSWQIWKRHKEGSEKYHHEVVFITRHDGYTISGVFCQPAEQYPGNEKWGSHGFTIHSYVMALRKLKSLLSNAQNQN